MTTRAVTDSRVGGLEGAHRRIVVALLVGAGGETGFLSFSLSRRSSQPFSLASLVLDNFFVSRRVFCLFLFAFFYF